MELCSDHATMKMFTSQAMHLRLRPSEHEKFDITGNEQKAQINSIKGNITGNGQKAQN